MSPRPAQENPPAGRPAARLDGERSRTRILDAAERLLAEKGYSGTGIAAISRESGLPASSIYWFFASKRELTMAVVERAADRFLSQLETPDPDASPGMRGLFDRGLAQFGPRLPDFLRLRFLLALERGDSDADLRERFRSVSDRIDSLAATAIESSLHGAPKAQAARIAEGLAPLAIALGNGALIARQIEPDSIDIDRLPEELEIAILAIAEHRLRQEQL
jgi:AcrR family transcriptional regulator